MSQREIVLFNVDGDDTAVEQQVLQDAGLDNYELLTMSGSEDENFLVAAKDADAVIVTYADLNRINLARFEKLKVIAKPTIGFDNIDLEAAGLRK